MCWLVVFAIAKCNLNKTLAAVCNTLKCNFNLFSMCCVYSLPHFPICLSLTLGLCSLSLCLSLSPCLVCLWSTWRMRYSLIDIPIYIYACTHALSAILMRLLLLPLLLLLLLLFHLQLWLSSDNRQILVH